MQATSALYAASLMLGLALAGCTWQGPTETPHPLATADPPHLHAGDRWVYQLTEVGAHRFTITMTVLETNRTVVSGGKDVAATVVNFTREDAGGGPHVLRQTLELAHDLSQIRMHFMEEDVDLSGNRTTQEATLEYDAPCQQHPWPMRVGATVTSQCALTVHSGQGPVRSTAQVDVRVEAYERITVPGGTFDAFRLNVTLGSNGTPHMNQLHWWAPHACGTVRILHRLATGTTTMDLVEGQCATPGKAKPIAGA